MDSTDLRNAPTSPRTPLRASARAACALAFVAALVAGTAGCSSGSAGGGVAIGSPTSAGDPVSPDFPVAYIRRQLPDPADPDAEPLEDDLRVQRVWNGPADVFVRDRAAPSAFERNVTERITRGAWDVRDLDVSFDGRRLLFSMRPPIDEDDEESQRPKWAIYEYELETDRLRRVIASDIVANDGHDVAPHYLPDGRIVFASSRQRGAKAILIDEGKSQYSAGIEGNRNLPAFVLHVMNADGTGIRQLSYNRSHDLDPTVLNDGRLLFTRWDNAAGNQGMHLYTMLPDGGALQLLYGRRSHATGTNGSIVQFVQARPRPDGRVVALMRPFDGTEFGGDPVLIDVQNYVENTQPARPGGGSGPAQSRLVVNDVRTIAGPSPGGRFSSIFPLWDGTDRLLTSWSQCRLLEQGRIVPCTSDRLAQPGVRTAPPLYGIWIYDPRQNTQLPIVAPQEGVMYTEVVALQPRTPPPALRDAIPGVDYNAALASEGVGILNIKSVYDVDGVDTAPGGIAAGGAASRTPSAGRPARFLRSANGGGLPAAEVREER
ncbi:MAG: TolB family protein, partial [Pseudomonadota bacterium]